jgi:hypothetical protein
MDSLELELQMHNVALMRERIKAKESERAAARRALTCQAEASERRDTRLQEIELEQLQCLEELRGLQTGSRPEALSGALCGTDVDAELPASDAMACLEQLRQLEPASLQPGHGRQSRVSGVGGNAESCR